MQRLPLRNDQVIKADLRPRTAHSYDGFRTRPKDITEAAQLYLRLTSNGMLSDIMRDDELLAPREAVQESFPADKLPVSFRNHAVDNYDGGGISSRL